MNSFRYLRTPSASKAAAALAAALAAATLAMPASAQQQDAPVFLNIPDTDLPPPEGIQQSPRTAMPAGASISDAQERVRGMAAEAGRSLEELLGTAVTPRIEAEVGEMAERQRRIMLLEHQLKEAKLARELWTELNGEEDSKASQEEIERLHAEKASLEAEVVRLTAMQVQRQVSDPDPVVAEITGAAGSMRAKVLVPYMGEFIVEPGSSLPNGMKVVGISKAGVKVSKDGSSRMLAFGSSVPRVRAVSAPQQGAPAR